MRVYTSRHRHCCGIDLHARTMYVCLLDCDRQVLVQSSCRRARVHDDAVVDSPATTHPEADASEPAACTPNSPRARAGASVLRARCAPPTRDTPKRRSKPHAMSVPGYDRSAKEIDSRTSPRSPWARRRLRSARSEELETRRAARAKPLKTSTKAQAMGHRSSPAGISRAPAMRSTERIVSNTASITDSTPGDHAAQ